MQQYEPNGRAAGKWDKQDIKLVAIVARVEGLTKKRQQVGDSLARLFAELNSIKFPNKFLLMGDVGAGKA